MQIFFIYGFPSYYRKSSFCISPCFIINHAHFCLPRCLCIRGIHCPSIVGISCYHLPILIIKFYVLTIARWQFLILYCSRSKFLSKLLKTFDKTFREIFPVFISTKRREKPSAFFDNNFVNNAYFSEAASSSSSHLASSSSKAPISSRMTCLCLWSS